MAQFCQPICEEWLPLDVVNRRVTTPGFFTDADLSAAYFSASWTGDGPGGIDSENEVPAIERFVALGTSTLATESTLHDGVDWETQHTQRVKEVTLRQDAGIENEPAIQLLPAERLVWRRLPEVATVSVALRMAISWQIPREG